MVSCGRSLRDSRVVGRRPHGSRVVACDSQVGSGALPTRTIPSAGLEMRPLVKRGKGKVLQQIAAGFRALPTPVIGRIQDDAFLLDLRCLEDESDFEAQLGALAACWVGAS